MCVLNHKCFNTQNKSGLVMTVVIKKGCLEWVLQGFKTKLETNKVSRLCIRENSE